MLFSIIAKLLFSIIVVGLLTWLWWPLGILAGIVALWCVLRPADTFDLWVEERNRQARHHRIPTEDFYRGMYR
jgi:hypothetical protein